MNHLKEIRLKQGLSQSQLVKQSNVSLTVITKYEQGQRNINKASGETLYKLATALKCSMEDLLQLENMDTP
ncbi:MAG TPA: helix-turn-helix transcriptional regulator [Candidatus Merdenecus merdavium]|nr:helix-turn-helix transcriptional regulator [Candidatus Merdenecus merdavium]